MNITYKKATIVRQFLDAMDDALSKKYGPNSPMGKILLELDQMGVGAVCVRGSGLFHLYKGPTEEAILRQPTDIDLTFIRKKGCATHLGVKLQKTFHAFLSQLATDYNLDFKIENVQRSFVIRCAKNIFERADYFATSADGESSIEFETKIEPDNPHYLPIDKFGQKKHVFSLLDGSGILLANPVNEIIGKLQSLENSPKCKKTARLLDMYNLLCVFPKREVTDEEWKNVSKIFSIKSHYFKGTLCSSLRHLDIKLSALLKIGQPASIKEPSAAERESFYQDLSTLAQKGIISHMPTREKSDQILDTAFILGVFLGRSTQSRARI